MKLSQVKPNPNNPRFIKDDKFERLVNSIVLFPQMMKLRPIVIDENFIALGGNMRDKAILEIKKRGIEFVEKLLKDYKKEENIEILKPIFKSEFPEGWVLQEVDLSEEQKDEFILKDNAAFGSWNFDMLANQFDAELLTDWGIDIPNLDLSPIDEEKEQKAISTTLIVECEDLEKLSILFNELQKRGFEVKLK